MLLDKLIERVRVTYAGPGEWVERCRATIAALLEWFAADPLIGRFLLVDLPRSGRSSTNASRRASTVSSR